MKFENQKSSFEKEFYFVVFYTKVLAKAKQKKTSIHHCDEARSFLFIVVQKRSSDKRIYLFCDNLFLL